MADDRYRGRVASSVEVHRAVRPKVIDHATVGSIGKAKRAARMRIVCAPRLAAETAGGDVVHAWLNALVTEIIV